MGPVGVQAGCRALLFGLDEAGRSAYNAGAPWLRRPRLPEPGERIRSGYAVFICIEQDTPSVFGDLLAATLRRAAARGLDYALMDLDERGPHFDVARERRHIPYRSRLFLAEWAREVLHAQLDLAAHPRGNRHALSRHACRLTSCRASGDALRSRGDVSPARDVLSEHVGRASSRTTWPRKDTVILLRDPDDARVVGFLHVDENRDHDRETGTWSGSSPATRSCREIGGRR